MFLGSRPRVESAEVLALTGFRVFFLGVEPVLP